MGLDKSIFICYDGVVSWNTTLAGMSMSFANKFLVCPSGAFPRQIDWEIRWIQGFYDDFGLKTLIVLLK